MTIIPQKKIVFLPKDENTSDKIEIFKFPSPSNNTAKDSLNLFIYNDKLYQLQDYSFSKSCQYQETENLATEKYHYNSNGEPIKSAFLINESDRSDGQIISTNIFQVSTLYDLAFSLIAVFYKESIAKSEEEYVAKETDNLKPTGKLDDRFLTARDIHDTLVDTNNSEWNMIPIKLLEERMSKIAESTVEGGDKYFKINEAKIMEYLLAKAEKIVANFPKSLPISLEFPEEIRTSLKYIMACNLLISLIPMAAYKKLIKLPIIAESVQKYNEYNKVNKQAMLDRKALTENAMKVGLESNGVIDKKKPLKVVKKTTVVKRKISVGQGAIDGFFKRQKK